MRLRAGEATAGAAAAVFVALAFLDWFESAALTATGWNAFSTVLMVFMVVPLAGAIALAVTTAIGKPVAWSIGLAVITAFTGILASVVLLLWLAFGPEVDGAGADARWPAIAGTLVFLLVPAGAWMAMADERTDAPFSAYEPPPARPAPGSDT